MSTAPAQNPDTVYGLSLRQRLIVWLLSVPIRLLGLSWRFRADEASREAMADSSKPLILILWHNRIVFTGSMRRRFRYARPISAMVSASRDGAWLTGLFHYMGVEAVRGSSSRRSMAAARGLIKELKEGRDIAITPDGPRGPVYHYNEGATMLAQLSGADVLLMCPNPRKAWRINAWDGLYVAKPFSRIDMRARRIKPDELPRERAACTAYLRDALMRLVDDLPPPPRCVKSAADTAKLEEAPAGDS